MTPPRADVGLAWGIKDSFIAYLDRLGDTQLEVQDGAALVTATGEFYFAFAATATSELRFRGGIHLLAHFGALDLRLRDPRLERRADGTVLTAAVGADERLALVDVELPAPVAEDGVRMWRDAPTSLRAESCHLFGGAYAPGVAFAPLTARIEASIALPTSWL